MQRERFYKGKGRGNRGGGGRGGNGNGGGRGRGGGRRRNGRGGGRGRGGFQRGGAESGNQRERIAVESGYLVLIDQFMLANPQFTQKLVELIDADATAKDELRPKWMPQVLRTLAAEAPGNPAARDFLAEMERRSQAAAQQPAGTAEGATASLGH